MNHSVRIGSPSGVGLRQADGRGGHTRSELTRITRVGARFHLVEDARWAAQAVGCESDVATYDRLEHLAVDRTAP